MPFPLTIIITTSNNMKALILPIVIVTLLFIDSATYGQTTSVATKELTWRSSELTDKSNSQRISKSNELVVHGQTSMELKIGNTQTLRFDILSVKGTWADEKQDGSLEYSVRSHNDVPGKVTIEKNGSSVTALVDFTQTNKNGLHIELKIDAIQ